MQLLFEILPIVLFFLAFKFYDIYVATIVGIVTTTLQVFAGRLMTGKWDNKQLITLVVFLFFGGLTLYFHNPIFVKWKPTIVFWLFSIVILFTQWFTQKTLMQRMMENAFQGKAQIPAGIWKKINLGWGIFFLTLGSINLYIAYHFSNDAWVNFKFYGIIVCLLIFSSLQAVYLMRYLSE